MADIFSMDDSGDSPKGDIFSMDAPRTSKAPKPPTPYAKFKGTGISDVASAGTALADVFGGGIGWLLGAGSGLAAAAANSGIFQGKAAGFTHPPTSGQPLQDIQQGAAEAAEKTSLSTYFPGEKQGLGYQTVMNKVVNPAMSVLSLPGLGIKALAERGMLGSERTQPRQVAELQAGTDVATGIAPLAIPTSLPKPKPGSMAWYNMLKEQAGKSQDVSEAAYNRSMYPKPVETPVEPPKPPAGGALQGSLFTDPETGVPSDARTPYNIPQAERNRVSEEIRQATADHTQGDLFYQDPTNYKAVREAEAKPGFLRDALDKINLRFESIRQMEEANEAGQAKLNLEAANTKGTAEDLTSAIDPIPVPPEVQRKAEDMVSRDENARFTEYLPAEQVWLLRDHNRLTDPKSDHQFVGKEASVLKNGINMPLEIKYSIADGKAVLTNGNTRTSLAMKHGLSEIPVRVTVTDRPLTGTEATNGVYIGKFDLPKGDAKPSDIGLQGRPWKGPLKQRGAIGLDLRRKYQQNLDELHDKINRGEELSPKEEENRRNLFRSLNDAPPTAGFTGFRQRGAVGDDLSGGPRKAKDVTDAIRRLENTEIRPLSEVTKGMARDSIKDLDGPDHGSLVRDLYADIKGLGRNAINANSIRYVLNKTGLDPIFTWVNKNMINIDLFERNMVKDILDGIKYARGWIDRLTGRGFEHRAATDGILPTLKSVPKGTDKTFLDTWFKGEGKPGEIKFDNPVHQKIYDTIQAALAKLHNMINEERAKLGLEKMSWLPNFYPHVREIGDYIVNVYDKTTQQHMRFNMFKNMKDAQKAEAALRTQFPDMDVRPAVHKQMNKWLSTDLDAIMEAARVNAQDHEVSKAMDKLIETVVSKRGAGGHLLQRAKENIGGWLGENRSMPDVEKALTLYTNNAVTYIANLKRRGVQKSIDDLRFPSPEDADKVWRQNRATGGRYPDEPNRLLDIAPRAHSYLTDYISQSRGALQALDKLDKAFMGELGKGLQIGESGAMRKIYALNNLATVGYLSKIPFFVSQFFQPILAIPRMMKLQNELGGSGGLVSSTFDFLMGYMHAVMPGLDTTGHSRGVVNYAIQRGMIDPTISHMLQASDTYGAWSKGFYTMTGAIEREVVRIPALLMIENSLRNVITDPKQRYEVATAQMYRAMAGTTRSDTPLLYTKMGPIGASAKTMKSYATNYYGQFAEYAHDIAVADSTGEKLKALRPLGAFLGLTALFGGINGIVGFQEADAAITLFNTLTTSNVKTPREWIMTSGMSDILVQQGMSPERARDINDIVGFGLASKMMPGDGGRDIQAQVGNPPTTSILSIVPYKIPIDMAYGLFPFIVAAAEGKMTDAIFMGTLEHLTLNNPHARTVIEAYFQQQGSTVPRPYMNQAGNFYRDQAEYWKTALSGMNTLDEKRADMALQFTKRHMARLEKDRNEFMNSFVDSFLSDKSKPVDWKDSSDKMMQYIQEGGSPGNLPTDIKNTMIRRAMPGMQYEQYKGAQHGGLGYAKKLEEIQQYEQMLPQPKADKFKMP